MNAQNGKAEQWLTTFTQQLRSQLPQNQYILTHARESNYFFSFFIILDYMGPYHSSRTLVSNYIKDIEVELFSHCRFSGARYKSGAYLTVNKNVGSLIDWVGFVASSKRYVYILRLFVQYNVQVGMMFIHDDAY